MVYSAQTFLFMVRFVLNIGSDGLNMGVHTMGTFEYNEPSIEYTYDGTDETIVFRGTKLYPVFGLSFYYNGPGTPVKPAYTTPRAAIVEHDDSPFGMDIFGGGYFTTAVGANGADGAPPMPFYTLNYNFQSPFRDTFSRSLSWGKLLNFNFATNDLTTIGVFGMRFYDLSFSYYNDSKTFPSLAGGTDQAWTGGIIFSVLARPGGIRFRNDDIGYNLLVNNDYGLIEFGYQSFTGIRSGKTAGYAYRSKEKNKRFQPTYYDMPPDQQRLNRATNFFRVETATNFTYQVEWDGAAVVQDMIHFGITDEPGYEYSSEHVRIGTSYTIISD